MKAYKVYFEFFGKKMKTEVNASSEIDARQKVRDKLNFLKVESSDDEMFEGLKDIFGMK